jgi:RNA polymerase sigma-70 factor (ECF subfamily)
MISDEQLALGVQQGSEADLRWLVERHHAPLLGFLWRMTNGDRPLAEDMVQETMMRMLRGIKGYDGGRPFKPWLYQIAVNVTRDYYKQAEMRHTQSANGAMELVMAAQRPETAVIAQETVNEAVTAVHQLPPHRREAILLRYSEGMALADNATILDVPLGTVKSRISLGLKQLRQRLEIG